MRTLFLALLFVFGQLGILAAAEPIHLRAGKLSLDFEPDQAFVRYVRAGPLKVLQGISAPVRDQFWGTVPPRVENVRVTQEDDSFQLLYDVSCEQGDIDFVWHGSITGHAAGQLTLTFEGQARSEFLRNRIGFCVLHGPEAAGQPCVIETVDGKKLEGRFPQFISPHQPFKQIRTVSHEVAPGVWAHARLLGDTYEMEDQRNWTDASFKTYCTPLEIPYPVRIAPGTKVEQRIELTIEGLDRIEGSALPAGSVVELQVNSDRPAQRSLPRLGLRVSSQSDRLTAAELARLRPLRLDHLRVDIHPAEGNSATARLQEAVRQAAELEVELLVALHLEGDGQQLSAISDAVANLSVPAHWLLIAATPNQQQAAREFLRKAGQKGKIGFGYDTNFTELNRGRPEPGQFDIVSYGVNPQIHAFDDMSIVETLPTQGDTIRSARQFTGSAAVFVSPITLRNQTVNRPPDPGQLPAHVDPRQLTPFAASWTLGSIKYLAEAGADRLTYFETVGWLGVLESDAGSGLPERFPSQPGQLFPVYHLFRELADFAGGQVHPTSSSQEMAVVGLALTKGDKQRLIVANLTADEQEVTVRGWNRDGKARRVGESSGHISLESAASGWGIILPAYAMVAIDGE